MEHNFLSACFVVCNRAFACECDTQAGRCEGYMYSTQLGKTTVDRLFDDSGLASIDNVIVYDVTSSYVLELVLHWHAWQHPKPCQQTRHIILLLWPNVTRLTTSKATSANTSRRTPAAEYYSKLTRLVKQQLPPMRSLWSNDCMLYCIQLVFRTCKPCIVTIQWLKENCHITTNDRHLTHRRCHSPAVLADALFAADRPICTNMPMHY